MELPLIGYGNHDIGAISRGNCRMGWRMIHDLVDHNVMVKIKIV